MSLPSQRIISPLVATVTQQRADRELPFRVTGGYGLASMNWQTVVDFFKTLHWQTVVAFFQASLTLAIAGLTVVIAVAQYHLAKAKFRHELYERRSAIYKAAMKFIAQVTSGGNAKLDDLQTFLRDTSEASFLFTKHAKQIRPFLKELYTKGVDLHTTNKLLESRRDPQHEKHADKMGDLLLWFGQQFDECRRLFAKDLSLV